MCKAIPTALLIATLGLANDLSPRSPLAVVVHHSNPVNNVRMADLQAMYTGVLRKWPDKRKLVPVTRNENSAPFRFLVSHILNLSVAEYRRTLSNVEFSGGEPVPLKVLNSDSGACKFVLNVPSAVAVIEAASAATPDCAGVKVLRVEGKLPGEEGYRLR
jgi:hypothetical protein